MQTQSNLEEDGMGAVIQKYLEKTGDRQKKKKKKEKKEKKAKPSRAKTPIKKSPPTGDAKATKRASKPKSAVKSKRAKTPSKSSSRSSKKKSKAEAPVESVSDLASQTVPMISSIEPANASILYGNLWWGGFIGAVCIFMVTAFMELNCKAPDNKMSDICKPDFIHWVTTVKHMSSVLPFVFALWRLISVATHDSELANFVAAAFIWMIASSILRLIPIFPGLATPEQWQVELMNKLSIASGILAQVFLVYAFGSSQYELAQEPQWAPSRAIPFAIIGYFVVTELLKDGKALRKVVDEYENDPLTCILFICSIASTCIAGWRAACRVGYGGVGWRSRRATKQILGVVGSLSMAFSLMLEFQNEPVLAWHVLKDPLLRSVYANVALWTGVGMYTASALMHISDDAL